MISFLAMAGVTAAVVLTLPLGSFWLYLLLFLALFTLTGVANGSSYRMIPLVFRLSVPADCRVGHERKASAALGFIGAIGGFGASPSHRCSAPPTRPPAASTPRSGASPRSTWAWRC